MVLGAAEVSLLDLTAGYGALANEGIYAEPFAVVRIRDSGGQVLYERPSNAGRRVISTAHAFIISDILSDSAARIPGFGPGSILELPFPAAVKTGTTTEFRDNWTVGYTPRQVIGVWVGNVDDEPMKDISGVDGAAPIWAEVMKAARAVQGAEELAVPPGLVRSRVCTPTGLLPGDACPFVRSEWFVPGTEPQEEEHYYARDPASGRVLINPPPEARPWLQDAGYTLTVTPPSQGGRLALLQPGAGEVLYIAPELALQEFVIRIGCPAGAAALSVFVDGREVSADSGCSDRVVAALQPGNHMVLATARAPDGSPLNASTQFEVRDR